MPEAGVYLAGFAFGNFFAEPSLKVQLRNIGKAWHLGGRCSSEKWLAPVGIRRGLIGAVLKAGGQRLRYPGRSVIFLSMKGA